MRPPVLPSFLHGKCPQCRKGKVFPYSAFNIPKVKKANEHCPCCGVKFESEPGFFWGAMYFSYALNVGITIFVGIIFFQIYEDPPLTEMVLTVIGISLIFSPFLFRLSRLLMMYLLAPYRHYRDIECRK